MNRSKVRATDGSKLKAYYRKVSNREYNRSFDGELSKTVHYIERHFNDRR